MKAFREALRGIWKLLRELSDEAAYERFLRQRGQSPSPEQWRHFCRHQLAAKYQRPKCC
ncbi:MAG: hypothetical protein K6T61_14535 [Bryobacteraceae bacterium]|nr:hypothetical protein [Bryobacteraceae bacterium]